MKSYNVPPSWAQWASFGRDELLYIEGWRRGFDVHELRALFWDCQQVATLRRDNEALKSALQRATDAQEKAEARAAWYRGQLSAESRIALLYTLR